MGEQLKKVRHDIIRYANCWEDADVLLEALKVAKGDRVLSIGSAGDNSFSLLTLHPKIVVAVDINPVQLELIQLKKAAFKTLNHDEFLCFLGFVNNSERAFLFQKVKAVLPEQSAQFWSARLEEIENGIIYQGKFEKYFYSFQTKILPLIHSKKKVKKLFQPKNAKEQAQYFEEHWNSIRWRLLFKLFFSRFVMGRLGRDPQFLKEVDISVSRYILEKAAQSLGTVDCQSNYFLEFILKGKFERTLPHYARKENFELIRTNIDRLEIFNGLAEEAFQQYGKFDQFNLSNIFEYMNKDLFASVSKNLVQNGTSKSRYAYWNLMVPRKMATINDQITPKKSKYLQQKDKGFFYADFIVEQKH